MPTPSGVTGLRFVLRRFQNMIQKTCLIEIDRRSFEMRRWHQSVRLVYLLSNSLTLPRFLECDADSVVRRSEFADCNRLQATILKLHFKMISIQHRDVADHRTVFKRLDHADKTSILSMNATEHDVTSNIILSISERHSADHHVPLLWPGRVEQQQVGLNRLLHQLINNDHVVTGRRLIPHLVLIALVPLKTGERRVKVLTIPLQSHQTDAIKMPMPSAVRASLHRCVDLLIGRPAVCDRSVAKPTLRATTEFAICGALAKLGGEGKILGILIGAFIIAVINIGMNLTRMNPFNQVFCLAQSCLPQC